MSYVMGEQRRFRHGAINNKNTKRIAGTFCETKPLLYAL